MKRAIAVIILTIFCLAPATNASAGRQTGFVAPMQNLRAEAAAQGKFETEVGEAVVAAAQLAAPGEAGAPALAEAIGKKTILVAEDSKSQRIRLVKILEREGYNVIAAEDGREALKILESETRVNLIISGTNMPFLSGFDLAQQRPNKKVPFILVSSLLDNSADSNSNITRALEKGKDYEARLSAAVKRIIGMKRADLRAIKKRMLGGAAVVISPNSVEDPNRITQILEYLRPFKFRFKRIVSVPERDAEKEIDAIRSGGEEIVIILNDVWQLDHEIKSAAGSTMFIDISSQRPDKITRLVEEAL